MTSGVSLSFLGYNLLLQVQKSKYEFCVRQNNVFIPKAVKFVCKMINYHYQLNIAMTISKVSTPFDMLKKR